MKLMPKEESKWEKEFIKYAGQKFTGVIARGKWDKYDVADLLPLAYKLGNSLLSHQREEIIKWTEKEKIKKYKTYKGEDKSYRYTAENMAHSEALDLVINKLKEQP